MFTCLWQLWDWLDPPPLFTTATMESKKLQQMQQANSHMAPQPMPQTKAPSYHQGEYRPQHSPVFQNHPQYQSLSSNFAQINMTTHQQPHLHVKPIGPGSQYGGTGFTPQSPPQHLNHYHGEQVYQNNTRERVYQQAPLRQHFNQAHQHMTPSVHLQQQYQQLQQAKLQAQLQTQSDALIQQQRTFAMRQQLNPPIPHYHLQSQTSLNQIPVQVQPQPQSMHRSAPPSSLNLTNQFQPAGTGKLPPDSHYGTTQAPSSQLSPQSGLTNAALLQNHKAQSQAIYQQNQLIQQQMLQNKLQLKSPQDQIIIQQNNPGSVMNQACQTQISGQVPKGKQQPTGDKTPSPSHAPLDRKKSGGTPIALKSPVTKRPTQSPVTLSGWLYKQGSEGLKVWRKRWFVLSDYCLFYYKGPEEEKLLGSILLPSYRVAACSAEDKIYRKYAFKCEHVNMRTYWLSAETAESMGQWVRALTAATMMQCSSESDQTPLPSMSSSQNPSGENSDSGIHTYQSQQSKLSLPVGHGPLTPASDGMGGGSSAGGSAMGGPQPLYANAPPKPKRANDGGYSSPSPEHSVERYDGNFETHHLDANQRRMDVKSPLSHQSPDSLYEVRRQMAKSPDPVLASRMQQVRLEGSKSPNPGQQVRSPYSGDSYSQDMSQALLMRQPAEEVYGGRENIIRAPHRFDDYAGRQIYGEATEREMQMRMAQQKYLQGQATGQQALYPSNERRTPDTYGRSRSGQSDRRNFSDYEDIYNLQQQAMGELGTYRRPMSPIGYQNNKSAPGRYTPNYLEPNTAAQHVQMRARPVQSTLMPRPHSADFLEYEARSAEAAQMQAEPARAPRPKSSLDINRAPDSYYYSEASYAEKLRQSALYQKPSTMPPRYSGNPFAAEMAGTMPREEYGQYGQRAYRQVAKGFLSPQQDQFLRSASARLPRKEEEANGRDSERRREESMKRLLEWKQRMLQSPLTRKGATLSATSTMTQPKSPVPTGLQRSRSETHANAGYNSYSSDDEASLSVQNVKNVQSSGLTVKPDDTIDIQRNHMSNNHEERFPANMVRGYEQGWMKKSTSQREIDQLERENAIRSLDMSAGDLLSRTHEELVLLLIQLRRQNSATARAIEQCCTDIHEVQNRIRTSDGQTKMDNISRLDSLKQQLVDLEKQYEKSKPLVNLVDNMVKLGSLYRGAPTNRPGNESVTLDRLEFNQRVQERRLLQEERRHWDRLSPNHTELQTKVQQLYQLDQLLQEESGTLQSLQRDKEDLERALGGLRARLQNGVGPPIAIEAARKQQHALERELSRVHQLLAENSKKLEQTVAGNARLEQELLVLRQKLQASRDSRGSQTALSAGSGSNTGAPDSITYAGGATAVLESDILELRRVQQLVGDMQRQRQELSQAVRQLTENSNSLYQQIRPPDHHVNSKKRPQNSSWMETDLDSMVSSDHANQMAHIEHVSTNPFLNHSLYVDTTGQKGDSDKGSKIFHNHESSDGVESSMDSDDLLEGGQVNGFSVQDKQEIKTVRIVKRESERRQRDRERTNSSSQNLDQVLEEETHLPDDYLNYARSKSLPRGYPEPVYDPFKGESLKSPRVTSKGTTIYAAGPTIPGTTSKYSDFYNQAPISNHYPVSMTERSDDPVKNYRATYGSTGELSGLKSKTESIQSLTKSIGELSPVFQSEAARQIIYEMSGSASEENGEKVPLASKHRRAVPKEKRRHNTAPSNVIVKTMQQIQSENDMNRNNTNWRARDDLDMEVALRPRSNAPDVVRSALGPREKISENTIDKLLAAPSKILIPERYIPEQPPELSPEEKKRRQEKVEAIKKMLSEAPINPSNDNVSAPPSQISAEKKQREHLLQLNQILAQQVMQMSKIVAEKAMATLPSKVAELTNDIPEDDQPSPPEPLPLYQQRDNYFT